MTDLYSGKNLLFLTDEQLEQNIEAMYFAYRSFTNPPDLILSQMAYGRAHHRALHFIKRAPGTTVTNLLSLLGITKQSLNRVLRTLIEDNLVENRIGNLDKRERNLYLTKSGLELEEKLSKTQKECMRAAFRTTGPEAVAGFRQVLEAIMDEEGQKHYKLLQKVEHD